MNHALFDRLDKGWQWEERSWSVIILASVQALGHNRLWRQHSAMEPP
jgi:hypothetical protein